ncbi:MAG: 50S ribosomal protein L29 [Verrucomicrobiales bacterium]|nr:50S ribosomal protein L29 [Verrucomicrobiota bacterium JB025]
MAKATPIRELSPDELKVRLRELKEEALNLRLQQSTGQIENTDRIRIVRREKARVLTALNEKASA